MKSFPDCIATSYSGSQFAIGAFERQVEIWNLDTNSEESRFETVLDPGGHRLVMSEDGKFVAAGAYHHHGVELYDSGDGSTIWRRKDLVHVQDLFFSPKSDFLYASIDRSSCHRIEIGSGRTVKEIPKVMQSFCSPFDNQAIAVEQRKTIYILDKELKEISSIAKESFAALDLAFSPLSIFVSEAAGSLSCYGITDGKRNWQIKPAENCHFLRIAYCISNDKLFGILWNYKSGGNRELLTMDPTSGRIYSKVGIDGPARVCSFASKGKVLITSDGDILDLAQSTGPIIRYKLEFKDP